MAFPPHKFVQVGLKHLSMDPLHSFELSLNPVPVRLHVLSVHPSGWVDKVKTVVNSLVLGDVTKCLDAVVCCPFVTVHNCAIATVLLDNGEECCSITRWHNPHNTKCRSLGGVTHAKHPNWIWIGTSSVMLQCKK